MTLLEDMLADVENAFDEDLMLSLWNCHAKNVSSIVVRKNNNKSLSRYFLAWPGHELATNTPENQFPVVGPHTHRYSVHLTTVCGSVTNYTMQERSSRRGYLPRDYQLWRYQSPLAGERSIEPSYVKPLTVKSIDPQPDCLFLNPTAIHSMSCSDYAAWHVCEGLFCNDVTRLYTKPGVQVDTSECYRRFGSAGEVIEHVQRFVQTVVELGLDEPSKVDSPRLPDA